MKANKQIKKAITVAARKHGKTKLAIMCGLVPNYPGLILSGKKTGIGWERWEKVWSVLVKEGGLDPNDPECLPMSRRNLKPTAEAALSPAAVELATRWVKLTSSQQKKVMTLVASFQPR